jgi:adenylosuccinate synthase
VSAIITVDLGYGDSGKGTIVDALVRQYRAGLVVRYNGGAQAAHNVITPDGRHHMFRQIGSGSFIRDTKTLLSQYMLVDPLALALEIAQLNQTGTDNLLFENIFIDERAMIVTPFHKALNRLREKARGNGRHGSCGMGIGEAMQLSLEHPDLVLRAGDLKDFDLLTNKLMCIYLHAFDTAKTLGVDICAAEYAEEAKLLFLPVLNVAKVFQEIAKEVSVIPPAHVCDLISTNTTVFEGAQGVLLDQDFGFHPYTTWSKTTSENAYKILADAGVTAITEVGIMRLFPTRHGPGPFPTEHNELLDLIPKEHNKFNQWQREFRGGWMDYPMLKYALEVNHSIDYFAVTHVDCLDMLDQWVLCEQYDQDILKKPTTIAEQAALTEALAKVTYQPETVSKNYVLDAIYTETAIPIGILSSGPKSDDKYFTAAFEVVSK